jgi:hypothetical protein
MKEESEESPLSVPPDFGLAILGALHPRIENGAQFVDLAFIFQSEAEKRAYAPAMSWGASLPTFESDQQREGWIEKTKNTYIANLGEALENTLKLLLLDACNLALIDMELKPYDRETLLHEHLAITEQMFREQFKMDIGRPAKWKAIDLALAISHAMMNLKSNVALMTKWLMS